MKKDINIREAKPYFPDTLPCEYDPPDTKQLDEEDYYESYNRGRDPTLDSSSCFSYN